MKKLKIFAVIFALILSFTACQDKEAAFDEQYDLGIKYLTDGNYEEAIIAFEAAIEIDSKNPNAYIKLADVYIEMGDEERAIEVIEDGLIKLPDNKKLIKKRETIISVSLSGEVTTGIWDNIIKGGETSGSEENTFPSAEESTSSASGLKDGRYHAENDNFDGAGYKAFVDMEIKNGAIVSLIWDELDQEGNGKRILSENDRYVMTEHGISWSEQSKAVCDYYIRNGKNGLNLDADGKTDAIAGVSISINNFINLTEVCLRAASANNAETEAPATEPAAKPTKDYITIKGKQYSTSLTELDLSYKGLTDEDIIELSEMTNLTNLNLRDNNISDLSPLAKLTNLEDLSLDSNKLSDVSPLAGLKNLTVLYLYYNNISDVSPLAGLTNLMALGLSYNNISDISPLAKLINLECLVLDNNNITDIIPLTNLTKLNWLFLSGNPISEANITALKKAFPDCMID